MGVEEHTLVGKTVVGVRAMTREEMEEEGWDYRGDCTVLIFSDGSRAYASEDPEGNGPGALFGFDAESGEQVYW